MIKEIIPANLEFRRFITWRRESLHMEPEDLESLFSPSYIRNIERGTNRVRREESLQKLYDGLKVGALGGRYDFDWFKIYANLDFDPYEKYELRPGRAEDDDLERVKLIERIVMKLNQVDTTRSLEIICDFVDIAANRE